MKRRAHDSRDATVERAAQAALGHALASCANRRDQADPDAVAAYIIVYAHVPEVRERALQLATAWAAARHERFAFTVAAPGGQCGKCGFANFKLLTDSAGTHGYVCAGCGAVKRPSGRTS